MNVYMVRVEDVQFYNPQFELWKVFDSREKAKVYRRSLSAEKYVSFISEWSVE